MPTADYTLLATKISPKNLNRVSGPLSSFDVNPASTILPPTPCLLEYLSSNWDNAEWALKMIDEQS